MVGEKRRSLRRRYSLSLITTAHRRWHETSHWHRRHLLQGQGRSITAGLVQAAPGNRCPGLGRTVFHRTDAEGKPVAGTTAWLIAPQASKQFAPSSSPFMVDYRVEDLLALVEVLKEEG